MLFKELKLLNLHIKRRAKKCKKHGLQLKKKKKQIKRESKQSINHMIAENKTLKSKNSLLKFQIRIKD